MGILDGGVAALFADAFGAFYLDATLYHMPKAPGGDGKLTATPGSEACKAQIDEVTEAMRQAAGYSERDVAIIILQGSVAGAAPTSDDEITVGGNRWYLRAPITSDPAQSYWLARGQRKT